MRRELGRPVLLIAVSIIAGTAAWSGHVLHLPIAFVFPILWAHARMRLTAAIISAGYFLAASRGLPQGVATFYSSDLWPGLLLWLSASLGFVAVHAMLWTRCEPARPFRYFAAAVLMAVPPIGITGWAHPITAAGVLFPGWGWWGLVAATAGLMGLVTRIWPAVAIVLAGFWIVSAATWNEPKLPETWQGVDLELGASLGRDSSMRRHRDLIATVKDQASGGARSIVLPESTLGFWTPTVERLWVKELLGTNATVIAGAAIIDAGGYDNVLVAISATGAQILYRERMPVPGSMWQPWRSLLGVSGGARAHFLFEPRCDHCRRSDRTSDLLRATDRLGPSCTSMLQDAGLHRRRRQRLVDRRGTSIVAIQRASAEAWARLFDKPLLISFNT